MEGSEAPVAPATPQPPATLGQMLRNARLDQDLTLEQLSTELRIEVKQLKALEEERFEQIGVPVFIKGYLKQYGMRLGLDVRDLLALYYRQTTLADVQVQPSRTIKLHDERQITSWILAVIVLLVVIAGLAIWWWNGGSFGSMPLTQSTLEPDAASPPPLEAPAPQAQAEPQPQPQRAVEEPIAAPSVAAPLEAPAPATTAPAEAGIPLEFSFEQESWAEVTDARGERLIYGLNAGGRRLTVRGEPPFAVVLGNADVVRLAVDGQPYAIPAAGRQGSLARFSVDIAEE
jgi:cytoskeleton protein RodZ